MAGMLETLQQLKREEFESFQWHLQQADSFVGDLRPVLPAKMEAANTREKTVSLIKETYPNDAQEIVVNVLRKMQRNDLVQAFAITPNGDPVHADPLYVQGLHKAKGLKGVTMRLVREVQVKTVKWKKGSVFGFGGDHAQSYHECTYQIEGGLQIPVFIQVGFKPMPMQSLKVDHTFQFGMLDEIIFLVLHDKSHTPYQHRFMSNPGQQSPFPWMDGDYLCNFE